MPEVVANASYSLADVAKHSTEQDCWVAVNGEVLDVTAFLPDHPGGVLAIVTFGGKDATEEFNMIHPPDVIKKYAPEAVIGKLGGGGGEAAAPAAVAPAADAAAAPAVAAAPVAPATRPGDQFANNLVTPISLLSLANLVEMVCFKPRGYFK